MVRYTLDSETCRRLGEASQTVELVDGTARVIGFFFCPKEPHAACHRRGCRFR